MSTVLQADCVEGFSGKAMQHRLSIDKNFNYRFSNVEYWVNEKLRNGFSVTSGEDLPGEDLLNLESPAFVDDINELFETFICEIKNGIQFVIRKTENHKWRRTYKFYCDKNVSIETEYNGVYPVGAIAFCK